MPRRHFPLEAKEAIELYTVLPLNYLAHRTSFLITDHRSWP